MKRCGDAMRRARVLDVGLQQKLYDQMQQFRPLPSIYDKDFIAANQENRADNVIEATRKREQVEHIRGDIRAFKASTGVEKVIVLWTANTERFADVREGLNDTAASLLASIERDESEVEMMKLLDSFDDADADRASPFDEDDVEDDVEGGVVYKQ